VMTSRHLSKCFRILGVLLALTMSYCSSAFGAHEPAGQTRHVFRLQYKDSGFSVPVHIDLEGKDIVFKKEPAFGGDKVVRGSLPTGKDKKEFIGFACDLTARKLHLDLNRNLDLTDDPAGTFQGRIIDPPAGLQLPRHLRFEKVQFQVVQGSVPVPYVIDIQIMAFTQRPLIDVTVRSGWQGEIELYGKKRILGVTDNLSGIIETDDHLHLRQGGGSETLVTPWSYADRLFVPHNLFFGGHAYDLAFAFEPGTVGTELVTTFTETHPALGELKITGQSIKRIKLEQGKQGWKTTVVLDSPVARVLVPVGTYDQAKLCLDGGEAAGAFYSVVEEVVVSGKEPAQLNGGGPLNHRVTMRRRGTSLNMDYALVGIGGERYERITPNPEQPAPTFAIYRSTDKVASGSFEYG